MKSLTTPDFWTSYSALPAEAKEKARKAYRLWQSNPRHPSLHFKKVGELWSERIDAGCRALSLETDGMLYWFRIGDHDEYLRLIAASYS